MFHVKHSSREARCSARAAEATRKADAAHGKRNAQHTRRAAPSAICTRRGELSAAWHTKRSASYPTQRKPSNAAPRTPTHFSRCILPFGEQSACLPHVRMRGGEKMAQHQSPICGADPQEKPASPPSPPEDQRREPAHHDSNSRLLANRFQTIRRPKRKSASSKMPARTHCPTANSNAPNRSRSTTAK